MPTAKNITKKLAEILKKVDRVEKKGHNDFQNYDYVTESDVVEALRGHLADAGILCVPHVETVDIIKLEKGLIATIQAEYIFTDGEETVTVRVGGSGHDNPGDKAIYKAMTGAEKYALKQLFLIPTGDDPERDEADHRAPGTAKNVQRGSRAQSGSSGSSAPASSGGAKEAPRKGPSGDGPSGDERDRTVAFGANKGKTLVQLEDKELAEWTKACEQSVEKHDAKWHKVNEARLAACRAEWEKRQPWRSYWNMIQAAGALHDVDKEGCQVILRDKMGVKSADKLVAEDVETFQQWMEELKKG